MLPRKAFTLIELLVVIAIIAILAVVVVLTLNPAQLLAQGRDAQRVSDMATLQSGLNLYTTDQAGASTFSLGNTSNTYISIPDPNASSTCGSLGLPSLTSSAWTCSSSSNYRLASSTGWIPVNFNSISAGSPFGSVPVDPVNQTSTGLFYAYNTNGSQFETTAVLESQKYKNQYGTNPATNLFPEVISGGVPSVSALFSPTGLVGYWPINEGSGSSTIDASGNGNTGSWHGTGPYYSSSAHFGLYAGNFDGTDDYFTASSTNSPTTALTFTAWVYATTTASQAVISWGTATSYVSLRTGGSNALLFQTPSGTYSTGYVLPTSQWLFVAGSWNGTTATLCANATCFSVSPMGSFPSGNYVIGAFYTGSTLFWNGRIQEVRVYNRILSAAEIQEIYNAEK